MGEGLIEMVSDPAIGVLDIGATGGRVFALQKEPGGLVLNEHHRFAHAPQSFWLTAADGSATAVRRFWDLGTLYRGMLDGLQSIASSGSCQLKSFGVDTWGSDGTWMSVEGDVLGLVATGRDDRWHEARGEIADRVSLRWIFYETGVYSEPFCVLNQIYWHVKHTPSLVSASWGYMPIPSIFHYWLSGERVAETTWMSTTQLLASGEAKYSKNVLDALGIPTEQLPPLVEPGTRLGYCSDGLAASMGLDRFEVVVPATHDTACAYLAAPRHPGSRPILISLGTWSLVSIPCSTPMVNEGIFSAGLTNVGGCEETYLQAVVMGTWPAQQLRREWSDRRQQEMTWRDLTSIASEGPGPRHVVDINHPVFYAPSSVSAAVVYYCELTGQDVPRTDADIARAIYDGLAIRIALACEDLESVTRYSADEIVLVGGGTRDSNLCQSIADSSGLPVRTGFSDATAAGNALVQARSLGWISSYEEGLACLRLPQHDSLNGSSAYLPGRGSRWSDAKGKMREWQRDYKSL